jgi:hypothetical protein
MEGFGFRNSFDSGGDCATANHLRELDQATERLDQGQSTSTRLKSLSLESDSNNFPFTDSTFDDQLRFFLFNAHMKVDRA